MKRFKKCCKVCTISNVRQTLEISAERYQQLIDAEIRLKAITGVAEADNGLYGYTALTSNTVDNLLGIERAKRYEK